MGPREQIRVSRASVRAYVHLRPLAIQNPLDSALGAESTVIQFYSMILSEKIAPRAASYLIQLVHPGLILFWLPWFVPPSDRGMIIGIHRFMRRISMDGRGGKHR